jgi:branched-chain amino acid transport system substrate-binding protein
MRFKGRHLLASLSFAVLLTASSGRAQTIGVADVVELSGGGASNGVNWRRGLEMAADEINAKGGILGHKIELSHFDTQTNASVARAMIQKALDAEPFAIMGPIYSGSVKASMSLSQQAEVPQFVGAQAAEITEMGNPYIFRANISQALGMARISDYMKNEMTAKKVAIVWVNNDFGKGGRDVLKKMLGERGIDVVLDNPVEYGSMDFSPDLIKVKDSGADVVFPYMTAEDTARFVLAYRKLALPQPLVGETTLLQQNVMDIVGKAADGALSHLSMTSDAPGEEIAAFRRRFQDRFSLIPDFNAMSSYSALFALKAVAERLKTADRKAIARALHGAEIARAQVPEILLDSTWDAKGDLKRDSFLAKAVDGKLNIIETLH